MKKLILVALVFALLFTACNNENIEPTITNDTSISDITQSEATSVSATSENADINIFEYKGTTFDIRNASHFYKDFLFGVAPSGEMTYEEAMKSEGFIAEFDGFTLATKTQGISYNLIDNADIFNSEAFFFNIPNLNNDYVYGFQKIEVGDNISDTATVTEAMISFRCDNVNPPSYFESDLRIKGEISLSGYASSRLQDGEYLLDGDIMFYVDAESALNVPLPHSDNSFFKIGQSVGDRGGFAYTSDLPWLHLGSILDYNDGETRAVPVDGSYRHINATLKELSVTDYNNRANNNSGIITKTKSI